MGAASAAWFLGAGAERWARGQCLWAGGQCRGRAANAVGGRGRTSGNGRAGCGLGRACWSAVVTRKVWENVGRHPNRNSQIENALRRAISGQTFSRRAKGAACSVPAVTGRWSSLLFFKPPPGPGFWADAKLAGHGRLAARSWTTPDPPGNIGNVSTLDDAVAAFNPLCACPIPNASRLASQAR